MKLRKEFGKRKLNFSASLVSTGIHSFRMDACSFASPNLFYCRQNPKHKKTLYKIAFVTPYYDLTAYQNLPNILIQLICARMKD